MEKSIISTVCVAISAYAFGGWSSLLGLLALACAIDYGTGILASIKEGKKISSSVGYWGFMKKALMFTAIMLAHRLDVSQGTTVIMQGAVYSFLANELVSISENYARLGWPLPKPLQDGISFVKSKLTGK
ncbi:holin family protein [Paenibacillus sp. TAB 01]|uniref:phage holin family protein n=1 Tax=Paenibacillus sp. TAB 01 TaxID=3368988 RepID=UPI003751C6BE